MDDEGLRPHSSVATSAIPSSAPPSTTATLPASTIPSKTSPDVAASRVLDQCLKLLKGGSDEHKFAGLVMVAKHVPALSTNDAGMAQLRKICDAVGTAFVHRLLKTEGDRKRTGSSGGPGGSGLSVYQQIALGVLVAFLQDESLVSRNTAVSGHALLSA